jgi:protein tyrosine phosphatase
VSNPIEQKKNRYYDVLPHKETRVVLQPASADVPLESDYINASHVDRDFSGGIRHKCVCTQAPVPESMQDFWHMVWQERSTLILMLTPLRDKERVKATQYWPELGQAALVLGPFSIECKRVDQPGAFFSTRLFVLRNQAHPDKVREVLQLHCETWPDHGVPDVADWANMEFLFQQFRFYRSMQPQTHGTLVHCSAGIGRTGCFLAIDEFITQIEIEVCAIARASALMRA